MSRLYEMQFEIEGFDPEKKADIEDILTQEWGNDDSWTEDKGKKLVVCGGQNNLTGGEGEDEFARRIARLVWAVNGGFCEVTVRAACLEYVPSDTHTVDHGDYEYDREHGLLVTKEQLDEENKEYDGDDGIDG